MLPLDSDTALIDTPGLRMFSIDHIPIEELQDCFPEFGKYLGFCHFRNCLHLSEPGCAVKEAVERNEIPELRYGFYREFMEEKKA
jgi:ribosome biogenesis GTPase